MPAGSETQVAATELERLEPTVAVLFERDDTFHSQIEKRPVEIISSRDMRIPLELRSGGKPGHFNPDGGDLGRGDMPLYDKAVINTVHLKFGMEWTAKRKWSTDNRRKAVIDTLRRDLGNAMKEFRRYIDSLITSGAGNGVLGTITSSDTSVPGVETWTMTTDGFRTRLLHPGWNIQVFTSNLLTNRTAALGGDGINIVSIDTQANTITVDVSVSGATGAIGGDVVVASGLTTTPPISIFGVAYHHSSSTLGSWLGFNRATTPEIRSNRVNGNSSALTLPGPRLAINKIGDRVGMKEKTKLAAWTHPCQRAAYEELGFEVSVLNKSAKEEGLNLYFSENMTLAGAPLKCSYSWDKTRIDFVDYDVWGRAEYHPAGFYKDENGQRYFVVRGASGGVATSNLAYLVASFNMFINKPPATAYEDNLAIPSGY